MSGLLSRNQSRVSLISKFEIQWQEIQRRQSASMVLAESNILKRTVFPDPIHGKDIPPVSGSDFYFLRLLRLSTQQCSLDEKFPVLN